jgi:hypothetical protein
MLLDKLTQEIKYWVHHFRAYLILSFFCLSLIVYGQFTYFKEESKAFTVISKIVSNEKPILSLKGHESGFLTDTVVSYAKYTNFNVGDTYYLPIRQADIKPEYFFEFLFWKLPGMTLFLASLYYLLIKLPPLITSKNEADQAIERAQARSAIK